MLKHTPKPAAPPPTQERLPPLHLGPTQTHRHTHTYTRKHAGRQEGEQGMPSPPTPHALPPQSPPTLTLPRTQDIPRSKASPYENQKQLPFYHFELMILALCPRSASPWPPPTPRPLSKPRASLHGLYPSSSSSSHKDARAYWIPGWASPPGPAASEPGDPRLRGSAHTSCWCCACSAGFVRPTVGMNERPQQ